MKIGITIYLYKENESLWVNGLKQNVLNLAKLLKNSNKYEVYLLVTSNIKLDNTLPWDKSDFPTFYYKDKIEEMDLLFLVGGSISEKELLNFKSKKNKKVVWYMCGSTYLLDMESSIFKNPEKFKQIESNLVLDEIWYIPQQQETNEHYIECKYRVNSRVVPFIWDNSHIDKSVKNAKVLKEKGIYKHPIGYVRKAKKRLTVMEQNVNIVKYSMIPSMIAETSYRNPAGRNLIDFLSITNADLISKNKEFVGTLKTFDLKKNGKLFVETRYELVYFLTQHTDVLISHQTLNPLNYLYLDAAYMGYPVLHNAWMVEDLGYYYNGFNIKEGASKLNEILLNHDLQIEEYSLKNQKVLWRYHADNKELIKTYDRLINNLFGILKEDLNIFKEYDNFTNNYLK